MFELSLHLTNLLRLFPWSKTDTENGWTVLRAIQMHPEVSRQIVRP